jgi:hypothetical protein
MANVDPPEGAGEEGGEGSLGVRIETKSGAVVQAVATVLRRVPPNTRRSLEDFISVVRSSREYATCGFFDIDRASAMLAPLWRDLKAMGTENYQAQVIITLPIFKRFSPKAQAGIIAHEFAHAERANRLGPKWHETMQSRYAIEERLANRIAVRWHLGDYIRVMRYERDRTVNPVLEAHAPTVLRGRAKKFRRNQDELRALCARDMEKG